MYARILGGLLIAAATVAVLGAAIYATLVP